MNTPLRAVDIGIVHCREGQLILEETVLLVDDRVEDSDLLPIALMLGNELIVALGNLICIVGGTIFEDEIKGDMEIAIVDIAGSIGQDPCGEEQSTGMIGQVLLATGNQRSARVGRRVSQSKVDHVREFL